MCGRERKLDVRQPKRPKLQRKVKKKQKQSDKLITSKHLSNYTPTSQFIVMLLTLHHTELLCFALISVAFNCKYNLFYFILHIL